MLWKFPHVGERIFKKLTNQNLAKCKKVTRSWDHFIIKANFSAQRKRRDYYEAIQKMKNEQGDTPLHEAFRKGLFHYVLRTYPKLKARIESPSD